MSDQLITGAVVRLKSGGPKMTIQSIGSYMGFENPAASCVWFDRQDMKQSIFELASLEVAG